MSTGFGCPLTESRTTDPEGMVGKLLFQDDKAYRFIKNNESSTALTLGQACCHQITGGVDVHKTVKIPLTADLSLLAGIVVATAGIAAASYGWVQCLGPNASISAIGATVGGSTVAGGSYLKAANSVAHLVLDALTQPAYDRNVQLTSTIATTTTPAAAWKAGIINCLG